MKISETVLPEFDQEMANTRKMLERVPFDKLSWKPHPKSFSFGGLATHIATMADWANLTMEMDAFDYAPPGAPPYQAPTFASNQEMLAAFDKGVAKARSAIAAADDSKFLSAVEFDGWRKDHHDHAEDRRHSQFRDEPHHPSSRPARRLPAAERYCGSGALRAHGRRTIGLPSLQHVREAALQMPEE